MLYENGSSSHLMLYDNAGSSSHIMLSRMLLMRLVAMLTAVCISHRNSIMVVMVMILEIMMVEMMMVVMMMVVMMMLLVKK